ncbi:MAG: hypothetical protein ACI3XD_03065 [Oscillospiraceae bacterium]
MKNGIKLIALSLCLSIIGCILFSPAEATLLREPTKAEAMISNYQESVHHSNQTYHSQVEDIINANVENDLDNFNSIGMLTESVSIVDIDSDMNIKYEKRFPCGTADIILINEKENGDLELNITEGNINQILTYTNDGDLYIDGEKLIVKIEYPSNNMIASQVNCGTISANTRDRVFSSTPFHGTTASSYSSSGTTVYASNESLNKFVINTAALSVISSAVIKLAQIGSSFWGSAIGVAISVSAEYAAQNIRYTAEKYAPTANIIVSAVVKHPLINKPVGNDLYYQYEDNCYVQSSSGTRYSAAKFYFYEYSYFC